MLAVVPLVELAVAALDRVGEHDEERACPLPRNPEARFTNQLVVADGAVGTVDACVSQPRGLDPSARRVEVVGLDLREQEERPRRALLGDRRDPEPLGRHEAVDLQQLGDVDRLEPLVVVGLATGSRSRERSHDIPRHLPPRDPAAEPTRSGAPSRRSR